MPTAAALLGYSTVALMPASSRKLSHMAASGTSCLCGSTTPNAQASCGNREYSRLPGMRRNRSGRYSAISLSGSTTCPSPSIMG